MQSQQKKTCSVGEYLLFRLKELGIRHVFGVPGDFNLPFLDQLEEMDGIAWVGNCNELNAAYAADGYARIHGIGALVTTFGVGELSAMNGIAGAYAEQVPVVQITGSPSTAVAAQGKYIHHTLGDGDFTHFAKMYKEVTAAQTTLTHENAQEEIDRVLTACWLYKRPVYINLPSDVTGKRIQYPALPLHLPSFTSDPQRLHEFLALASEALNAAKSPVILADYEVNRHLLADSLLAFVTKSGFPVATSGMGKGVIDENHPQFIGMYHGKLSAPYVRSRVEDADCIISIGVKLTDVVTGAFTHNLASEKIIELHPSYARIGDVVYGHVAMRDVLEQLTARISHRRTKASVSLRSLAERQLPARFVPNPAPTARITQERFWKLFGRFLKPADVVVADTGTAFFGASIVPFPQKTTFVAQPLWASIGYALPALLGTQLAASSRRNILLIGDGAFQVTAQELSTIIAHQLKPIMILINNDGYTIERLVHTVDHPYNNIQAWQYHRLPDVLGDNGLCLIMRAETEQQLYDALKTVEETTDRLAFIEVVMDRTDGPELLNAMGKLLAGRK